MRNVRKGIILAVLLTAGPVAAQAPDPAPSPPPAKHHGPIISKDTARETARKAGDIATQPARDVGIMRAEIPEVLAEAAHAPYSLKGLKTCKQLTYAILELNAALGPDFAGGERSENRAGKFAEAGGKAVVNSLIPFRGLVREVSGAAPAQRALNAAIDAGYARRGFLRGVRLKQGCKGAL